MPTYLGNCWPNLAQTWLLKAALETPRQAQEAWENWVSRMDIDKVDAFSYQMMPKIYKNLATANIEFSHAGLLKGIYKRHWMHNQLLLDLFVKTARSWSSFSPQSILLTKGGAMCAGFYEDWGVRVLGDLDLLLPKLSMRDFMAHLLKHGFEACDEGFVQSVLKNGWSSMRHAVSFKSTKTQEPFLFDVHITPLVEISSQSDSADASWFQNAVPVFCQGETLYRLGTTDLLFQTCVHGTQYSTVPLLRWIMDAVTLLRKSSEEVDWEKINWYSRTYALVLPMRQALSYLKESFDVPIPTSVLSQMDKLPVSKFDQTDFNQKNRSVGRLLHIVINLWSQSRRQNTSFLLYLKSFWGLSSAMQIPWMMLKKTGVFWIRERKKT